MPTDCACCGLLRGGRVSGSWLASTVLSRKWTLNRGVQMTLQLVKAKDAPKSARSKMETLLVNVAEVERWRIPPFQRPLHENEKVRCLAEELKCVDGGCVPGVVTLGRVTGDPTLYVVDGQHRLHAFRLTGMPEAIIDVRICDYADMNEMALDFV